MNVFRSRARAAGQRKVTMRKAFALVSALAVALAVSTTIAPAQGTTRSVSSDDATKVRDLTLELVGQVQNSAPGVSPATSIQYGYLSYLHELPIFKAEPQNESTALFSFYTDTTTSRVFNTGSIRVVNREGTLTVYSDPAANGSFASPDSFRDGTPVLVAGLRQQVILDTTTGAFTAQNLNTIISTSPLVRGDRGRDRAEHRFPCHVDARRPGAASQPPRGVRPVVEAALRRAAGGPRAALGAPRRLRT